MKLYNLYKQILGEGFSMKIDPSCDCCKYFDFTFSQAGGYFAGLLHPVYYAINKNETHTLTYITPEQYIRIISKGFGLTYQEAIDSGAVNKETVLKYAKAMKSGEKFPIGWYRVNSSSQEGRHRALAAMELGCKSIPVVVFRDIDYEEKMQIVKHHMNFSREELNNLYKENGYNGITDLDWRELNGFISRNNL